MLFTITRFCGSRAGLRSGSSLNVAPSSAVRSYTGTAPIASITLIPPPITAPNTA